MINISFISLIREHVEDVRGAPDLPSLSEEEKMLADKKLQEIRAQFRKREHSIN